MTSTIHHFQIDGLTLAGTLHLPDRGSRPPVVIGSHGLFSSRSSPKQVELAERCSQQGIAFFRFDHRGCGQSEGDFQSVTTLDGRCRDMLAAIKTVRAQFRIPPRIGFFGSSLGGAVCLKTAADINVTALVVFAPPLQSGPIYDAVKKADDLRGLPDTFYLEQLAFDITHLCSRIKRILVFHGTADLVVPVAQGKRLYEAAQKPKMIILQKNGDHMMQSKTHQIEFMDKAIQWWDKWFKEDAI